MMWDYYLTLWPEQRRTRCNTPTHTHTHSHTNVISFDFSICMGKCNTVKSNRLYLKTQLHSTSSSYYCYYYYHYLRLCALGPHPASIPPFNSSHFSTFCPLSPPQMICSLKTFVSWCLSSLFQHSGISKDFLKVPGHRKSRRRWDTREHVRAGGKMLQRCCLG